MNFSFLENVHEKWLELLVIGKTIERENMKYHIVGMTLSDEAKLYIIEPFKESEHINKTKKEIRNQRTILKEQEENECCYLNCSDFYLGKEKLEVQGGTGSPLKYSLEDYGVIQLFLDMMGAGWTVPEWLKDEDWDNLQLVTLEIANLEKLPEYSPETPITIKHNPVPIRHILEKSITLNIGKTCSFSFTDHYGDKVQCYINDVALIDVWKNTEEQFTNPALAERLAPEQLQEVKKHSYEALEQSCPKGMCYIGIEYECSKDISLSFYSKQYLQSRPEEHQGSAAFMLMHLKPDKETGTHHLPLKGDVMQTPVSPDTIKIPAELFLYFENIDAWAETVP